VEHRGDIDGLRAIAVLSVLFFHFNFGLTGGYTGVDVFFVISGFVIAKSIIADSEGGTFSIANFYFKRIRRLFPAYAATMVLTTIVACLVLLPPDLADYGSSLFAASAFFSNVYFWKVSGYFATAAHTKPLLHTWSLSVEEQFYLFAPVMVHVIHRFGGTARAAILTPLILVSFAAGVVAVFIAPTSGFFLLPTRAWELFIGVFLALMNLPAPGNRAAREAMAAGGAALIVTGCLVLAEDDPFPGWNALYPCVGTALIILAGNRLGTRPLPMVNGLLATRLLVGIGLISYSLYLVHWPIAAFARYQLLRDATLPEAFLMLAASFALATLMWRYVEQPFRRIDRAHLRWALAGGGATVLAGCAAGALVVGSGGFPTRHPDFAERRIPGWEDWGGETCFNQNAARPIAWSADACTRIRGSRGRTLLWGDSFAAQYLPGIIRHAKQIDTDVLQYTFAGCPPILADFSYARIGCFVSNQRVLSLIAEHNIDTVVMAALWTNLPKRTLARLPETIAELKKLGVRVVVFGQSPQFSTNVQRIDYVSGARMKPGVFSWTVAFRDSINAHLAALVGEAEFVDPMAHLCADQQCPYRQDDDYLFLDYGHLSQAGAMIAVAKYFPTGAPRLDATAEAERSGAPSLD
jgi:peptidoglycan/LPS O-acetylase OafA/YrhL